MDSVTQIVLGAAVGQAVLGKKVGNRAMLWGAIAGTVPDLDVAANFFYDDLTAKEMHRGFSHSILFSVLASPILGKLAAKIHRKRGASWKGWSWLMFGSLLTHSLLDAHTNWGTMLFWPFEFKVAYKNIFIVDPLYTIPFLICLIWAMRLKKDNPRRDKINNWGLYISTSYLALTLIFKSISYYHFTKSLEKLDVDYVEMDTNPTAFNSILWTASVELENEFLIGYYSLLDGKTEPTYTTFDKNHDLLEPMQHEDLVQRLIKLSEDWYLITQHADTIYFNDIRFGQFEMSDNPDSFGFSHKLWYENGVLQIKQREPEVENLGAAIASFLKRI